MSKNIVEESHYDFVIFGTGLSETALSSFLSKNNYSVLIVDKNDSYGSEFATLNFKEIEKYFSKSTLDSIMNPDLLTKSSQFNIDLTPKLLLLESKLKDFLLEYEIDQIVNFSSIKGSYFYSDKLYSIPRNEAQSLKSSAVGFWQKPKVAKFFYNLRNIKDDSYIFKSKTMKEEFESFGLNQESRNFIGHAIALNLDDSYLQKSPKETYDRIIAYIKSIVSYDNSESPYIYPQYGLSDICQGFVRKASLNGAVFMLNAEINKIQVSKEFSLIYLKDPNGDDHKIKAKRIISDPSYFIDDKISNIKSSVVEKEIIRCILICRQNKKYDGSRNITFLKDSFDRKSDVFCVILNHETVTCPEGYEIAILSTIKETEDSKTELEEITKKFDCIKSFYETRKIYINEDENVIFTKSIDESPLMDNVYDDIHQIIDKVEHK